MPRLAAPIARAQCCAESRAVVLLWDARRRCGSAGASQGEHTTVAASAREAWCSARLGVRWQVQNFELLIEGAQYDWVYHEHMSYFCVHSFTSFLRRHGLHAFNVR